MFLRNDFFAALLNDTHALSGNATDSPSNATIGQDVTGGPRIEKVETATTD